MIDCKPTNVPNVYAKISYEGQYNSGGLIYGNVVFLIYQDQDCSIPLVVNNLTFIYNYLFPCSESGSGLTGIVNVTRSSYLLRQNELLSYWDSLELLMDGNWVNQEIQCFNKYYLINDPGYQIVLSN